MISHRTRRNALLCGNLAAACILGATVVPAAPTHGAGPAPAVAPPEKTMSDFPGLRPLVAAHRAEQEKMTRLWRSIKEGNRDDAVKAEYKAQQERTMAASNKVSDFIARDNWSAEDKATMQRLWAAELEKPFE
jgi:hypothetical protein